MEGLRMEWGVKLIMMMIMASMFFRGVVSATNYTVGGISGWDLTSNIQAWTSETNFHVGDYLVFLYTPVHDVLEVEEEDYQSCDVSEPISTHNDGETVIPLTQEGTRYFTCGRQGHCSMGLKLEAQVLASSSANVTKGGSQRPPRSPPPSNSHPPPPPPPPQNGDDNGSIETPPNQPNNTGTPPLSHAPGPTSTASRTSEMEVHVSMSWLIVPLAVIICIQIPHRSIIFLSLLYLCLKTTMP